MAFTLFGIAVPQFSYSSSVFPVIFGVAGLSLVYHAIDRFVPDLFKLVVVPALSLMIVIPLNLMLLAPIGAWCGIGLANGIVWLFSTLGPVAGFLLGFFMPLIVLFGMHQSTSPIQIANIAQMGYDYLLPVSFCHNLAESGASFGASLRMKDPAMRSAGITSLPVYMDPTGAVWNIIAILICLVASFAISAGVAFAFTKPIEP